MSLHGWKSPWSASLTPGQSQSYLITGMAERGHRTRSILVTWRWAMHWLASLSHKACNYHYHGGSRRRCEESKGLVEGGGEEGQQIYECLCSRKPRSAHAPGLPSHHQSMNPHLLCASLPYSVQWIFSFHRHRLRGCLSTLTHTVGRHTPTHSLLWLYSTIHIQPLEN